MLKKDFTGSLVLGSSHSLLLGHKPDVITHKQFCDKLAQERQSLMKFGLFDSSSPNYTTYYPDVDAKDLVPAEGDFVYPVFRALSETIVSKYLPIDFSKKGVLKNSLTKLIGQTINVDHEVAVGNAIGTVKDAFWQNSYKTDDGKTVPAGINIVMMIDGKSNPRIVRGVMMNPPSIHSNSVSVRFKWEPSHKFKEENEFFQKVGSYDKEGELIRAVVTEIITYTETSLVPHGADVFAQKINDKGKIVNPSYSHSVYNFSNDTNKTNNLEAFHYIDYKDLGDIMETSEVKLNDTIPVELNKNQNNNNSKKGMDKDELEKLEVKLGFKPGELTVENYQQEIADKFSGLQTELTNLKDSSVGHELLKTEDVATLRREAEAGKLSLAETRNEAIRLYKLCKGDKEDSNIVKLIQAADFNTAKSFLTEYKNDAEEKFQSTCKECGAAVTLSAAIGSQEDLVDEDGNPVTVPTVKKGGNKSINDTITKFRNRRNPSRLFKKNEDQ